MVNFNQRNNFAIKITVVGLMIYTFSVAAESLSTAFANAPDINYHINLNLQTKQTAQKNNHKNDANFKQEPLLGKLRKNFNLTTQFTGMQGAPEVQKQFKKLNQSKSSFIKKTTLAS